MADLAADVADALAARFEQPVDVLGISTGGSIAQQLAADHPTAVRRLALVSTACRLENSGRRFQQEMAALAHEGARREVFARFARDLVPPRRGRAAAGAVMAWLGPLLYPHAGDLGDLAVTLEAEDSFELRGACADPGADVGRGRWPGSVLSAGLVRRDRAPHPGRDPCDLPAARPPHCAQRPGCAGRRHRVLASRPLSQPISRGRLLSMPTALVTGISRRIGIGWTVAERLIWEGWSVTATRLAAARRGPALGWWGPSRA